ncbi:MAG: rhamnulokinase [Lachnospiraceae bacterium]|jgi:rhamnulokinase|nr:rhamnulokinase [Lachnospiraceae bacterium]
MSKRVLAFDFGASSGRAIIGEYDGERITLQEVHRFSNDPVIIGDTMYWDTLRLFFEMKQGMVKAKHAGGFESIGIDTWGVDFGMIDKGGRLLENPIHYRDARTVGLIEESFKLIDREKFYGITGLQFMEFNTAFQLLSLVRERPEVFERTDKILLTPDLLGYFLTGEKHAEFSIASTTQLMDAYTGKWSKEVLDALGIPGRILPEIIPCGTKAGKVTDAIKEELGLEGDIDVIAVAGHDTQSAMVSVPTQEKDFIFMSCGTWSLFGTELDKPLINETSSRLDITNESGYGGRISFLKNIIGLWMIQESRRQWIREGREYSFGEMEKMAQEAEPLKCFVDTAAPEFNPAGNIPRRIREYCEKTGQYVPQSDGEIVRCINQSLAMKYRNTIDQIKACTGKEYPVIYMLGGGIQSHMLCQLTASACHREVSAGPIEATVYGNIALQLMATGEIKDINEARRVIAASEPIAHYAPQDGEVWEEAYKTYLKVTGQEA